MTVTDGEEGGGWKGVRRVDARISTYAECVWLRAG